MVDSCGDLVAVVDLVGRRLKQAIGGWMNVGVVNRRGKRIATLRGNRGIGEQGVVGDRRARGNELGQTGLRRTAQDVIWARAAPTTALKHISDRASGQTSRKNRVVVAVCKISGCQLLIGEQRHWIGGDALLDAPAFIRCEEK